MTNPRCDDVKVRLSSETLFVSGVLGLPLTVPARADFGIFSHAQEFAMREAIKTGKLGMEELDAVWGNGPAISALVKETLIGYPLDVKFETVWDELREVLESDLPTSRCLGKSPAATPQMYQVARKREQVRER